MITTAAAATWTAGSRTREIMSREMETFRTYQSESFPGYLVERWDGGLWGVFDGETFCTSRETLKDAKALVADLSARATVRQMMADWDAATPAEREAALETASAAAAGR